MTASPYRLDPPSGDQREIKLPLREVWARFRPYLRGQERTVSFAFIAIVLSTVATIATPYIIARSIDRYILHRDIAGLRDSALLLLLLYGASLFTTYFQANLTGTIAQQTLFRVRGAVFSRLQELPLAFFHQNRTGDLISRINNDTEKVNTFLAQGLGRFFGNLFTMVGVAIFIFTLNVRLSIALVASVSVIVLATLLLTAWSRRLQRRALTTLGLYTAEVQENLNNFKLIVAFDQRDYFVRNLAARNEANFRDAVRGSLSGQVFRPIYSMAGSLSQLIVLLVGLGMVQSQAITIGLLIGFLSYTQQFYQPLHQIGAVWGDMQSALAGWARLSDLLRLESDLPILPASSAASPPDAPVVELINVDFGYDPGQPVLRGVNLAFGRGRTYALVGPTGGGKSTTAALMARLYDPTAGEVRIEGRDIRTYSLADRAARIGFILQEPFLFTGTVGENLRYGNTDLQSVDDAGLEQILRDDGLDILLTRFDEGLSTPVSDGSENISLGQKQIISFVRAILRKPALLILDEATANIDTVTERLLEHVIDNLAPETTRVIIAHRLNTIERADEILFINEGRVQPALSFDDALHLLESSRRSS